MNTQTQLQVIAAVLIDLKQKVDRGEMTDEEAEDEAKRRLARPRRVGSVLLIDNDTTWPDPFAHREQVNDAVEAIPDHTARHHVRSIINAYRHLAAHPAGTEAAVQSLRSLRRAVRISEIDI